MVFCGRPSQSCEACRIKRGKCDRKRPGCSQCQRAKRPCPGYRDVTDVIFRDESDKVITKYQQREQNDKLTRQTGPRRSRSVTPLSEGDNYTAQCFEILVPSLPVAPPEVDFAINFLFCHYLVDSHFKYLPGLYAKASSAHRLNEMLSAVGFAALALQSSTESLTAQAQATYTRAVSKIQTDLDNSELRLQDETLAAILLMALYETLTLRGVAKPEAWEMHARGAMALLLMRGEQQLNSEYGRHLFTHAATMIRFVGIQRGFTLPDELSVLMKQAKSHPEAAPLIALNLAKPSSDAMEQFATLFTEIEQGALVNPYDVVLRANNALESIDSHARLLSIVCTNGIDDNRYPPQWTPGLSQAWSNIYIGRMKLNALIHEHISVLSMAQLRRLPAHLQTADCAERYRWATVEAAQNIYDVSTRFFPDGPTPTILKPRPQVAVGYFLIWPLWLIGCQPEAAMLFRHKASSKLRQISEVLCLPHARTAAEVLAGGAQKENWMHTVHAF